MCYNLVTFFSWGPLLHRPWILHSGGLLWQTRRFLLPIKATPLRRKDDLIYYGDMSDSHIIQLQILESKPVGDLNVATKVSVQLQRTAPDLKGRDRVVKRSEKDSLYAAMDVASVWLDRALSAR